MTDTPTLADLTRERDLYRVLVEAARTPDPHDAARRLVNHAVEMVGAARGYLALYGPGLEGTRTPRVSYARACSPVDVERMQDLVSSTVIDDTLRTQRVTSVASALGHPTYVLASSVQENRITSVICAPLGTDRQGVLYVQDRVGGGVFSTAQANAIAKLAELSDALIDGLAATVLPGETPRPSARTDPSPLGPYDRVIGTSPAITTTIETLRGRRSDRAPVWLTGPRGAGKALLARELCRHAEATDRWTEWDGDTSDRPLPAEGTLLFRRLDLLGHARQDELLAWCVARGVRLVVTSRGAGGLSAAIQEALAPYRIEVPGWADRVDDARAFLDHLGHVEAGRFGRAWRGMDADATTELTRLLIASGPNQVASVLGPAVRRAEGRRLRAADLEPADRGSLRRVQELFDEPVRPWRETKHAFQAAYLERAMRLHGHDTEATSAALDMSRSRLYEALGQLRTRTDRGDG